MGGGNMSMEYPYESNQGHYPLWKPPSSYFPRGEAPPPYEEAIALAQAEAAINTCTVSVATTTHRTVPMNMCNNQDENITTNTTNLINININNAGTITSVAAGENHQISNANTQPRSTQTNSEANRNTTVSVCAYTNPEPQNNLPSRASICNNVRCQSQKEMQTISNIGGNSNGNIHFKHENNNDINLTANAGAILPPPLFDGSNGGGVSNNNSNSGERRRHNMKSSSSSSRRYHRTIPRHFTSVDPIISAPAKSTDNPSKKPTCQCPVQHVPMSYMGTTHFNQQTAHHSSTATNNNGIFLTTLSTKLSTEKTSSSSHGHTSTTNMTSKSIKSILNESHSNASTLSRRTKSSSTSTSQNYTAQKIQTISKPSIDINSTENAATSSSNHIHSILKNKSLNSSTSSLKLLDPTLPSSASIPSPSAVENTLKPTDIMNPPFPIPFIDSKSNDSGSNAIENNYPVLPPKMYKNHNNISSTKMQTYHSAGAGNNNNSLANQKIHTISKCQQYPNVTQQMRSNSMRMSFPNYHHQSHSSSSHANTKSLRRNNSSHNTAETVMLLQNTEKSQSLIKINSVMSFPANHIAYSLPKPNSNGKLGLRSSIADVVSKVPSVITIPSPSSSQQIPSPVKTPPIQVTSSAAQVLNTQSAVHNKSLSALPPQPAPVLSNILASPKPEDKPLPVCTTSKNCSNPKEHFLPNDTSLDDDYLSECENCKSAHGSRYYLDEEIIESPQETMTLQRKPTETEEEHDYYRTSQTLPTNTKQKTTTIKNREPWFSTIPASSSSDEEINE